MERTDYDGNSFREGSGAEDYGFIPPPPPPPDGKHCPCGKENCCNYHFNDTQADSGGRGLKGDRGLRVSCLSNALNLFGH